MLDKIILNRQVILFFRIFKEFTLMNIDFCDQKCWIYLTIFENFLNFFFQKIERLILSILYCIIIY